MDNRLALFKQRRSKTEKNKEGFNFTIRQNYTKIDCQEQSEVDPKYCMDSSKLRIMRCPGVILKILR